MPEAGSLCGNGFIPSEASSLCNENEQIVMVVNILPLSVLQAARLFDSLFLKVSVDQLSHNLYIPIRNPQGGGVEISSFSGDKSLGSRGSSREI